VSSHLLERDCANVGDDGGRVPLVRAHAPPRGDDDVVSLRL